MLAGLAQFLPLRVLGRFIVTPDTLLRWNRCLAAENPAWDYRRVHGEAARLGHRIAPSTVWAILERHGIDPAQRRTGPTWSQFLTAQARGILACDTFIVDTVLLRQVHVLFFIEHATRRVHLAGITTNLTGAWCTQSARNLSMNLDLGRFRFLIRDNATTFIGAFDSVVTSEGNDIIRSPPGAPRANASAERFVRSVRTEPLDHTLIWNERQLRELLDEYVEHYNTHRPHRGISQRAPATIDEPAPDPIPIDTIRRRPIPGGLINEYRDAA